MDRETYRQKSEELVGRVEKAYSDFTAGKISAKQFDQICDRAEAEGERNGTLYRSRQKANQFAAGPDEVRGGWAAVQTKGSPPSFALDGVQVKAMYEKAAARESFSVRCKDTLGFNDTAIEQLPPQLAPWITKAVHERRILDRLPTTACDAPSYEIVQHVSTTGAAGVVAEGTAKPEVKLNLNNIVLPMIKLALHSAVSWETISDYDRFTSYLQLELPLQVVDVENQQLLYGTGADGQIQGLYHTPSILTHNCSGHSATEYLDDIEESIEQLRSGPALAEPDLFVISPSTWSALRRTKDDLHRYVLSPDPTREEATSLWGVETVVTTQCEPGDAFLIDTTKMGKAIIREGISFRQGTADDDFVRNLLRWVVEERLNLGVERPSAVLYLSNLPFTNPSSWAS